MTMNRVPSSKFVAQEFAQQETHRPITWATAMTLKSNIDRNDSSNEPI